MSTEKSPYRKKVTVQDFYDLVSSKKRIENVEISDEIYIDSIDASALSFYGCKFSTLRINARLEGLTISRCEFEEIEINSDIKSLNFHKDVSENGIIHADNVTITTLQISDSTLKEINLGQLGKVIVNEIRCFQSRINLILLYGKSSKVFFNQGNKIQTSFFSGEIGVIEIANIVVLNKKVDVNRFYDFNYFNEAEKGTLSIQRAYIKNLLATGQHVDTFIELHETSIENAAFHGDFGSNGSIKIKTCNELSKISFGSANIANLEVFNSDLSDVLFLSEQSIFEKIRWQSVQWSDNLKSYKNSENIHELDDSFRRETLRILKLNAQIQQDTVNYIKFHSLEQQAYWMEIKTKRSHYGDKILLCLNFISNNHGMSWRRGVLFSISVGAIFFTLCLLFLNKPYWEFGWTSWSKFGEVCDTTIKLFSQFLYSAHSFEYLNVYEPKGFVSLLDLIGRIFVTYGYYQTIVAFRKFGRR